MKNPYLPTEVRIAKMQQMTKDTILMTLKSRANPIPGMFVQLSVAGIGECPISICSYNGKKIELLVRVMGNVTKHIASMQKDDLIGIRGPYGTGYPMEEMEGKDIVIIAGGTGIAPPKSVIEYIQTHREKYGKVKIFVGFREPKETLFSEFLNTCQRNHELNLTYDKAPNNEKCRVGFVTDLVENSDIASKKTAVVMCGPPVVIKLLNEILRKKGFEDKQIYISLERHMKCGIGKCGHCSVAGKYVCRDGPVFRLDKAQYLKD